MLHLAFKNLISKPLNTILSILLLLLSISLATFVLQVKDQLHQHLENNIKPFDMVIGAKGSPLQLVLSSVLHIDNPTGNIPLEEALKIVRNPMVKDVIPVSYGDNYEGHRILGTPNEYLLKYGAALQEGEIYEKPFEVVIGKDVANKSNLQIGDTFVSAHGLAEKGLETHDEKPFIVKGILKPTGAIIDHLIITSLESIWEVHEHEDEHIHQEAAHEEQREITSLLVKFRNPLGALQMSRFINEKTTMQAALPKFEIERLIKFLGIGFRTINGISVAILLVAGLSIFINLIKTVRERKQELALLRTYGANTFQLIKLVFFEALFLSLLGSFLGWFLGRISIWFFTIFIEGVYGYNFVFSFPNKKELSILVLVIVTTLMATILASLSIFKLNASKTISDV
ncbi:ABC transporter permease [Aquimarina sp. 2201CG5-10]|uniref:ABC transporter permease n=1 Tax=Aquimarina callyspongiae TaxID=3098150 RepID=UPI002AB59202|nr:FtsX-like permease family protein [Aquimarina sp. 2201CG5-10]MDY8134867.1 FtsX-like permease family protein [Aquimarina sp. 2201CG5-10]